MSELRLNGKWKVTHLPYLAPISHILDESFVPEGWLDACVPEEIHATLRRAGVIRGHTYGKDTDEETWIEEADWVYYKEFYAPAALRARQVVLDCQGLDTFCDIYLNGVKLGSGRNMHVPFTADIGDLLRYGTRNVLVVRFYSPVKHVEGLDQQGLFSITTSERLLARKAQMNYSWDFCGRCVTTGIWKEVSIRSSDEARIGDYYLYTKAVADGAATIGLEVEPELLAANAAGESRPDAAADDAGADTAGGYRLEARLTKDGREVCYREGGLAEFASLELTVEAPLLWWPRPYGSPELYDFSLTLKKDGKVLHEKRQKFGIRTIEIVQEDQADGRSFIFAVNGRRLFVRGANWVPTRMIYTDITDRDYEVLLDYAAAGNISMLRIWGGGIYESPRFFELCDELGIMVWNDFMLACGIYPQQGEFLDNMAAEAEHVLRTYRNWTSLVVWAGDNENGQAYGWAGRPYEFAEDKLGYGVIDAACRRLDPHRSYMPTSPYSPDEFFKGGDNPSSPYQGDSHIYIMSADPGVNANRDYGKNYYKRIKSYKPRFMSEFGFISLPEKDTFYKFNFLREKLRYPGEMVEFLPMSRRYIENGDHDETIRYSQSFNAMALKYWIEYFRSLKWTCAGSLYWKFNDPVADCAKGGVFPSHMSTVDMYGLPKMTYYYTRRAYDDLIVVCDEAADGARTVFACSELLEAAAGTLTVTRLDFAGRVLETRSWECLAAADSATPLCRLSPDEFRAQDVYGEYLKLELTTDRGVADNRYLYADIGELDRLALGDAGLKIVRAERSGGELAVTLRAERYARHVRLHILDRRASYSDNYFELDAGQEKRVAISLYDDLAGLEDTVLYVEAENAARTTLPLASL